MCVYWRDGGIIPSEAEYVDAVANKVSSVWRVGVRLMMGVAGGDIDLVPLADVVALTVKFKEDYESLVNEEGEGTELELGPVNLPVLHAAGCESSAAREIVVLMGARDLEMASRKRVLELMRDVTGSLAYTERRLGALRKRAVGIVRGFGAEGEMMRWWLDGLR